MLGVWDQGADVLAAAMLKLLRGKSKDGSDRHDDCLAGYDDKCQQIAPRWME